MPFITDASSAQIGGPDDYAGVQTRGDVLVYTGDVLSEPLDVIGPISLVAHVDTSAHDADFTAMLLDVHPNGFAQRLCDGVVRLRYRDGHQRASPVQPGDVYEIEVVMWDTCQRFLAGHRVALQVASSAYPKYAPNLGTVARPDRGYGGNDRAQPPAPRRRSPVAADPDRDGVALGARERRVDQRR